MNNEDHWLSILRNLNPNTGKGKRSGKAPHKPLLLLSVLDAIEDDEIEGSTFQKTPNLVVRFLNYSAITSDRWPGKLKIQMPFFHLSSQGVWQSFDKAMQPATKDSAFLNEFDEEFVGLCRNPDFRTKARMVLISTYFTEKERIALFLAVGLSTSSDAAKARDLVSEIEDIEKAERKGRSTKFRSDIVIKYRRTCALTGYRCDTINGRSIVDAAHIDAFGKSFNDETDNGLALSKNAHWMFDQGLWVIDDDLRIVVLNQEFEEAGPQVFLLSNFHGRHLQFDPGSTLRPSLKNIRKHRSKFST